METVHHFPTGPVRYYEGQVRAALEQLTVGRRVVLVTDSHVAAHYPGLFEGRQVITIPAGEASKSPETAAWIAGELIGLEADRQTLLAGVGGGVVTDITGYVAGTYMRGIACGFVPTSLLGMVDASIGGKNGVNLGLHKNILGLIRQPEFIIFDSSFLRTLPAAEWSNGFAEVIKYACLFDPFLFERLTVQDLSFYRNDLTASQQIIAACAAWKTKIVAADEDERGARKLLNFGHTAGHALEKLLGLPHGSAISIGMVIACRISEQVAGLPGEVSRAVERLLVRYGLPARIAFDPGAVMALLRMDKKRAEGEIDYIVLEGIGKGRVQRISFDLIREQLISLQHEGNS